MICFFCNQNELEVLPYGFRCEKCGFLSMSEVLKAISGKDVVNFAGDVCEHAKEEGTHDK